MDSTTRCISEYVANLTYEALPASSLHAAKRLLLDSIGCAVAAYDMDAVRLVQRVAKKYAASPGAGVLGLTAKTTPEHAAFANTTIIRYLDWNDSPMISSHPSDNFGHILAVADAFTCNGPATLLAAVIAYEIHRTVNPGMENRSRAWDDGPIVAIAAACTTGKLLNLTQEQIANAIGIAAVSNIALRATRTGAMSMWRGSATAQAGRNGVFAAFLAQEGMTGPSEPFEGEFGFWQEIAHPFELSILGRRNVPYAIECSTMKYFPACYVGQAAIWAVQELRQNLHLDDVVEIRVTTSLRGWKNMASDAEKWAPQTRETADHSLPYVVASMLARGSIAVADYSPERLNDPTVRSLMPKVKVLVDDEMTRVFPEVIRTKVEIVTHDGQVRAADIINPKGHDANPLSDDEVQSKFRLAAQRLGGDRCDRIISWIESMESADSIGELFTLVHYSG